MSVPRTRQVGAPDGNLLLDLHVLHERIGELIAAALEGTGVRPAEYAVYSQLALAPMSPRELRSRLGVSASTLTGHLGTLDRRGHTRRVPEPADGRSYRIALTDEGRVACEACRTRFRVLLSDLHAALGTDPEPVRRSLAAIDAAAAALLAPDSHGAAAD
jgi:DNA-binding MarR family transcriptional regulator